MGHCLVSFLGVLQAASRQSTLKVRANLIVSRLIFTAFRNAIVRAV